MNSVRIVIEKHPEGYIAYPLGIEGAVVAEGDMHAEALADVQSALQFHIETFGMETLTGQSPVLEAYFGEAVV